MNGPQSTTRSVLWTCLLALLVAPAHAAPLRLEKQPAPAHAFLVAGVGPDIRDDAFAKMMKGLLGPKVGAATFLFQQCFGGGMLDDLERELGAEGVKWVGGSAARHDQMSWGGTRGVMPWSLPLIRSLGEDPFRVAIADAIRLDSKRSIEAGQGIDAGGGGGRLRNRDIKFHHAILWGGAGERDDLDTIRAMRNLLISAWGPIDPPNVTITVLFNDGKKWVKGHSIPRFWQPKAASLVELQKALKRIGPLTASDQELFFYAADHGTLQLGVELLAKSQPMKRGNGQVWGELLIPEPTLSAINEDAENRPFITVRYTGHVSPNSVEITLNDTRLDFLAEGLGEQEMDLPLPERLLTKKNILKANSTNPAEVTILSARFTTGGIAEGIP